MMKMPKKMRMIFWMFPFIFLTSVSSTQQLKSINDLKKINFGQSVPSHSLLLLHWFANEVNIDNNMVIRLTFNPNQGDYGSHHYGNYERLLEPLPQGFRYYTVGNLNQAMTSLQLPSYVRYPRNGFEGHNRDRIIFRVRVQSGEWQDEQEIDRVYITQHYESIENQGTRYDPDNTYQITNRLLRQIREFSVERSDRNVLMNLRDRYRSNADDAHLGLIGNAWGNLACLGLLVFIVINEKYTGDNRNKQPQPKRKTQSSFKVNIPERRQNGIEPSGMTHSSGRRQTAGLFVCIPIEHNDQMTLEVTTCPNGKAAIAWKDVPGNLLRKGVLVALYRSDNDEKALDYKYIGNKINGTYKTSVPLNERLQVRLHKAKKICCFWRGIGEELSRGEEFKNPPEVRVWNYNAMLQLFAKDGKACVRLYVDKSFNDWRTMFKDSWIGLYTNGNKATKDYAWWRWQWATKLEQNRDLRDLSRDIYEYHSGMPIAPGVQARFILREEEEKARTPCWQI